MFLELYFMSIEHIHPLWENAIYVINLMGLVYELVFAWFS